MLLYGTIQSLQVTPNCEIYNFSSLNEKYTRLHILPPKEFGGNFDYDFDIKYANYILSNDYVFFDFMMIIYSLYQGKDVFIIIDDHPNIEPINDSLFKLIQQRYGYNANRINSFDDLLYAEESGFNELGIMNLDNDKYRLAYMLESERIANGGRPYAAE